MFKEEIIPNHVDKPVYVIAPALALIPALVIWAVIPIAKGVPGHCLMSQSASCGSWPWPASRAMASS